MMLYLSSQSPLKLLCIVDFQLRLNFQHNMVISKFHFTQCIGNLASNSNRGCYFFFFFFFSISWPICMIWQLSKYVIVPCGKVGTVFLVCPCHASKCLLSMLFTLCVYQAPKATSLRSQAPRQKKERWALWEMGRVGVLNFLPYTK